MRIATWNVNSIRARLERALEWIGRQEPDVLCLQETKCTDEEFPRAAFEGLGYHVETYGQRTYNGVALLSREPMEQVVRGLPGDDDQSDRRVIGATVSGLRVLNLYVVNGERVGSPKYEKKLEWLDRLLDFVSGSHDPAEPAVLTGDFNITRDDRDVYDPERWREKILCSTPEREYFQALLDLGYVDALREQHPHGGVYTWWDFRTRGFERGQGMRIDHFLLSEPAARRCVEAEVDLEERGRPKPSDHAPVVLTLD